MNNVTLRTLWASSCYTSFAFHPRTSSIFIPFFSNETNFHVQSVLKMRATSKATWKRNPQHFSSPLFSKGGIILWSSVFFRFIPAFLLCLLRCERRVWRYSFCYKCGLLSYDVLTAMVLTFAHFCNEWH